jgi:hypothetical protein
MLTETPVRTALKALIKDTFSNLEIKNFHLKVSSTRLTGISIITKEISR